MKYCCFQKCKSDSRYHKDRKFYPIPKPGRNPLNYDKCLKWIEAINRDDITVDNVKPHHRVCNLHFADSQGPSLQNPYPSSGLCEHTVRLNVREPLQEFQVNKTNDTNYSKTREILKNVQTHLVPSNLTTFSFLDTEMDIEQTPPIEANSDFIQGSCLNTTMRVNGKEEIATKEIPFVPSSSNNITMRVNGKEEITTKEIPSLPSSSNNINADSNSVEKCQETIKRIENFTFEELSQKIRTHHEKNKTTFEWSISLETDKLILSKQSTITTAIRIEIDKTIAFDITVFEKKIDRRHEVYASENLGVKSFEELLDLLSNFDKNWNVCLGVSGSSFEPYFRHKLKTAYYCSKSNSLRSNKCEFLKSKSHSWCPKYFLLRNCLLKRIRRKSKNVHCPKSTNIRYLNLEEIRRAIAARKQKNKALLRSNKSLKQRIQNLIQKDGVQVTPEESEDLKKVIDENPFETPSKFQRFFLQQQLKYIDSKTRRPQKWHPAIIHWCLYLKSKSTTTYEALRQVFTLPTKRTLYSYSANLRAESGFHPETIIEMKEDIKFDTLKQHQKYISIMIDEMALKKDLIYRVSTGEIVGLTNSNDSQNKIKTLMNNVGNNTVETPELATHVMQFMIRGLTTSFKYPYAYFPCDNMKADELYSLLWEAVENLQLGGFNVLTIVCDKAGINQKLIKMCCADDGNRFQVGYKTKNLFSKGEYIYFISDVPHLIKTIRNGLEASGNCKNTRFLKKNGKHMLWSHVEEVFKKDCELESGLKLASKIKYDHIYLTSFSRMKVNYAAQVLSKTMASAMKMLVGDEASETITFIELVNNFFDAVNVTNLTDGKHNRNHFKNPYTSLYDWRFKWLKETFLGYFEEWQVEVENLVVPKGFDKSKMLLSRDTRDGITITVNSIIEATQTLLKQGADFVLTERFNQDPLERYFGKQRAASGANDNPNVLSYQQNIPNIKCLRKSFPNVRNGNISVKSKKVKILRRLLIENSKE